MPSEREITAPVDLCLRSGRLNPLAVGWTRQPLHRSNLRGWGRSKRWEYWAVQAPDHVLALTVSHLDYLALHTVWFVDLTTGAEVAKSVIVPLGRGLELPPSSGVRPVEVESAGLKISLTPSDGGVRLQAWTDRVTADVFAQRPDGHESLGVVIPWRPRRFQYTVKDNTLPATGSVVVDGQTYTFSPPDSWAVLDHGRGRWPYRTTWNWGSGSGVSDGHVVGLQLGGQWTDGTGMTENALCIDGRLTKVHEDLVWEYDTADWMAPWQVRSASVKLTFTPRFERSSRTEVGVIGTSVHQCFGTWDGMVIAEGESIAVKAVRGFAEEARMRW